jgi:hypothetical protein
MAALVLRRRFFAGCAATVASRSFATERCTVSTQGGDYAHLLHEIIERR